MCPIISALIQCLWMSKETLLNKDISFLVQLLMLGTVVLIYDFTEVNLFFPVQSCFPTLKEEFALNLSAVEIVQYLKFHGNVYMT